MLDKLTAASQKLGPGVRQVLVNLAWLFTDQILQMGLGLVVGLWVARYLGPVQFGLLNYAIAFVSVFSSVATRGLGSIIIRDIARNPECNRECNWREHQLRAVDAGIVDGELEAPQR